jgi:hypothetical protein
MNPRIGVKRQFTSVPVVTNPVAAITRCRCLCARARIMRFAALLSLFLTVTMLPARAINIWINEIHYDNASTDVGEFIEITGLAGTSLSGYSLVLYNGSGGGVYATMALSGIILNQQNGFGSLAFAGPSGGIQNGAPDGMALVDSSSMVIQFLSYEGAFTAVGGAANGMLSTSIGVSEAGTETFQSLQLTGSGDEYQDFTWTGPIGQTPGAVNDGQFFVTSVPDAGSSFALLGLALGGLSLITRFRRV